MDAISLILAVVKLLNYLMNWATKQGYINEGRAQVFREQLESMADEVRKARAADSAVSDDADSVQNDPNNRDRDTNGT